MRRPGPLRAFVQQESAGGLVLLAATAAALLVANSPLAGGYRAILDARLGPLDMRHWIDDGLMALFFLLVGLEMKREMVGGHLARASDRLLPAVAALGGMAAPAVVYLLVAGRVPGLAQGWAIPAATDIAFAVGVLALIGRRVPRSIPPFLTAVAVIDDMGAVAVIALFYTGQLAWGPLLAAAALWGAMLWLCRRGVASGLAYAVLGLLLWAATLLSGVHPTVAGVLAAFAIPIRATAGGRPLLHRLEERLHPWVAFGIVPLFAFANAGLSLGGLTLESMLSPLPLAVALGLFLGKQAGLFGAVRLMERLGLARRPEGASGLQLYGVALLCGIGFTMSLFIGGLAFPDPLMGDEVRLGVLAGSLLSAVAGFLVLRFGGRAER